MGNRSGSSRFGAYYGTPKSTDSKFLAAAEAKQRNRAMRNDVDTRSALTGITWKQGEQMWRDKYAKTGMELSLDSNMHLQQIYDLMGSGNNLKPAAPAPAAPAASAPLMPQISAASQQYRADTQALSDKIAKQQADFDASQAAAAQSKAIAAANQSRSFQAPNLQIQPASSTPKTAGTDIFRIRKRRGSDQKQLTSSLNIGQSNTLNI